MLLGSSNFRFQPPRLQWGDCGTVASLVALPLHIQYMSSQWTTQHSSPCFIVLSSLCCVCVRVCVCVWEHVCCGHSCQILTGKLAVWLKRWCTTRDRNRLVQRRIAFCGAVTYQNAGDMMDWNGSGLLLKICFVLLETCVHVHVQSTSLIATADITTIREQRQNSHAQSKVPSNCNI